MTKTRTVIKTRTVTAAPTPQPTQSQTVQVPGHPCGESTGYTVECLPAPAPTPTAAPAAPTEVYCTYERMDVAVCNGGGYVTVSNAAYQNALSENPNDPGSVLSGDYPVSEVTGN